MQMNIQHNQNLWDAVKAVLREKVLALSAYIGHEKKSPTNDLSYQFKKLEKKCN